MTISMEDAQKAWAYSPKGKMSSRERADLNSGTWSVETKPKVKGQDKDKDKEQIPVLVGQRFKAVPHRNEKQNIAFTVEKI